MVVLERSIVLRLYCPWGYEALIHIEYPVALLLKVIHSLFGCKPPLFKFMLSISFDELHLFHSFALNHVEFVYLGQQCRIDSMITEVLVEKCTPFLEGLAWPFGEGTWADDIRYVFLCQEPVAISFSNRCSVLQLPLLSCHYTLFFKLLKSLHV